jgi:hypothetical protein
MWKSRRFVVFAVIAAVVLVGCAAGVALAQTNSPPKPDPAKTLMGRVAAILGIDQQQLQSAFDQANRDMENEALDNRLKGLVDQGKMTQQQADQYKKWWQDRPSPGLPNSYPMPQFRGGDFRGRMPPNMPPMGIPPMGMPPTGVAAPPAN